MTTELAIRPSKRLEAAAAPIWRAILDHPYLKELAAGASQAELARAERNYVISSRYEWLFWDAALNPRGPNGWFV